MKNTLDMTLSEILDRIEEIELEIAFLTSLAVLIRDKFQTDPTVNPDYIHVIDVYAVNRNYKLKQELDSLKRKEEWVRYYTEEGIV